MQRRCPAAANVTRPHQAAGVCTVVSNFLAVTGDASGLATCSNMLLYCAEHHATCAAQVTLNALRRHQQEGRASGTPVQVEASSVGTRPDSMLGRPRGQRGGPRGSLESARRSRSSCGGSARAGGSLFVLGGRPLALSAEAVAALETRMVDAYGSGLGGMQVWAHDSAVAHVLYVAGAARPPVRGGEQGCVPQRVHSNITQRVTRSVTRLALCYRCVTRACVIEAVTQCVTPEYFLVILIVWKPMSGFIRYKTYGTGSIYTK